MSDAATALLEGTRKRNAVMFEELRNLAAAEWPDRSWNALAEMIEAEKDKVLQADTLYRRRPAIPEQCGAVRLRHRLLSRADGDDRRQTARARSRQGGLRRQPARPDPAIPHRPLPDRSGQTRGGLRPYRGAFQGRRRRTLRRGLHLRAGTPDQRAVLHQHPQMLLLRFHETPWDAGTDHGPLQQRRGLGGGAGEVGIRGQFRTAHPDVPRRRRLPLSVHAQAAKRW